jgi:GTP-binding protein YchF
MSLSVGIVGLPNVGKSTLFNALLQKQAALAANYPFATIEPNVGIVPVPDAQLPVLAEITGTTQIIPATVEFVDIAGLVKGAAEGAGLGNKFLSHIRNVSFVLHVVRAFEDENILREGSVSPRDDYETISTELQLSDLSTLERQTQPKGQIARDQQARWETIQRWREVVGAGQSLRTVLETQEDFALAHELGLLSAKPEMVALNVSEEQLGSATRLISEYSELLGVPSEKMVVICAKLESELATLSETDKQEFLEVAGLSQTGLENLIRQAYTLLGLQSFYTAGEKEVRAWTIRQGTLAPDAAGVIHTDFITHFIRANIVSFNDFVAVGGWKPAKEKGKLRQEGRNYVMQTNDVVEFLIGK